MTKEDETLKCKFRFKGIENFLRRVAFNLGNTPSQTEVKIISCIPIDVTDLQQKIIQLEKQLEDSRNVKEGPKGELKKNGKETTIDNSQNIDNETQKPTNGFSKQISTVHTAECSRVFPRLSKPITKTEKFDYSTSHNTVFDDISSQQRKSTVSLTFSPTTSTKAIFSPSRSQQSILTNGSNCSSVTKEIRPKLFTKNKKNFPKKKINSQLVYYTETDGRLLRNHGITKTTNDIYDENDFLTRSYLSNMIRKQYESMQVRNELSNTSYFTSPICKDVDPKSQRFHETDICSCCLGTFHNLDDYFSKSSFDTYSALALNEIHDRNKYYDASLYDLIPVKETPVKNKKQFDIPKRKEPTIDMKCCPEDVRIKAKKPLLIASHRTTIPHRNVFTTKLNTKINNKKDTVVSINPPNYSNKFDQQTEMESSTSYLVDIGDFNTKPSPKQKTIKLSEKPLVKNAECLTSTLNHSECQTLTVNSTTNASENKTDDTLNQIKCILQSVLTQVKTNSQVKSKDGETKKDAVVQNGLSQNNMQDRSSLLDSFTYSPYNINSYGPSCSKQMPSNYLCYPSLPHPVNCLQNYPLIIQGTGRHLCTDCFQSSHIKHTAITTSTNTEQCRENRSKETEKLIKEIYKSVALGMPTKDTFQSEYDDEKSAKEIICSNKPTKQKGPVRVVISELFTNRNVQMDTSMTDETNTTICSKTLKTDNPQSHLTSTNTDISNHIINKNAFFSDKTIQQTETETEGEVKLHPVETKRKIPSTVSENSESEDSDTECVDSVSSVTETQVKKKAGLFCRMRQIFNKSKKMSNIKKETEAEVPDTSDSDDYQTIYSHKSEIPKPVKNLNRKSSPHSKIFHSRRVHNRRCVPEKHRRTPYMEQEYRRLWNEKLMFHNQKHKFSSEKPLPKTTGPRLRHQHPYYQNYEARGVLVDSGILYRPQFNQQNRNSLYTNTLGEVVHRTTFGQQSNPVPNSSNNGKYVIRENRQPGVPLNAFYKRNNQNNSPSFVNNRQEQMHSPVTSKDKNQAKGLTWFTKHKMGLRCGKQWKQLLLES